MTKVVIYSNATLESFYKQTIKHLKKYHSHPTKLNSGSSSENESARISYYDAMARASADQKGNDNGG